MSYRKHIRLLLISTFFLLTGCTTANHGTFVVSTYNSAYNHSGDTIDSELGKVKGVSKQTWFLYAFPVGSAPATDEAIADAKSKIEGTKYLTDLSIDDRIYWKFGYSEQVIEVKATAHK